MKHDHHKHCRMQEQKPDATQECRCRRGFNGPCVITTEEYRKLVEERAVARMEVQIAAKAGELLKKGVEDAKKEIEALRHELEAAKKAVAEAKEGEKMYRTCYYAEMDKAHKLGERVKELEAEVHGQDAAAQDTQGAPEQGAE